MIRIDEDITLLDGGADIIQKKEGFRFGIDAVILAEFFSGKTNGKILEIGSGTGIIPILLCYSNDYQSIKAVEIQEEMADSVRRNVERNGFTDKIEVHQGDIKRLREGNSYDYIISNPPYMTLDGKKINNQDIKTIARHEVALNLEELISNSKRLLKPRGSITIVHRAYRLGEILVELQKNGFSPKRVKNVHSTRGVDAQLILVEASKGRKEKLILETPLYLDEREVKEYKI